MKASFSRVVGTLAIWLIVSLVAITYMAGMVIAVTNAPITSAALEPIAIAGGVIVLAMVIGAAVVTHQMWSVGEESAPQADAQGRAAAEAGKAKHSERQRLERLLDSMDDDEVIELETLLMSRERGDSH